MSFTKLCTVCGTQFEGRTRQDKYCSDECRRKQKNLTTKEYVLAHKTIEKVCENCGKPYMAHREASRFCSKNCARNSQKVTAQKQSDPPNPCKSAPKEVIREVQTVNIRITKALPVYDHLKPKVGAVYTAEKKHNAQYANQAIYIIPGIAKYGLLVREDECEEVIE